MIDRTKLLPSGSATWRIFWGRAGGQGGKSGEASMGGKGSKGGSPRGRDFVGESLRDSRQQMKLKAEDLK